MPNLGPCGITVNNVQPGPIDTDANPADSDLAARYSVAADPSRGRKPIDCHTAIDHEHLTQNLAPSGEHNQTAAAATSLGWSWLTCGQAADTLRNS